MAACDTQDMAWSAAKSILKNAAERLAEIEWDFYSGSCSGNGEGGALLLLFEAELVKTGVFPVPSPRSGMPETQSIARAVRTMIFERDGYRCVKCGSWKNLHLDHIHPKSKGGTNDPENLQTLCGKCNVSKGNRI
jgi:hypothetical protein